MTAFAFGTSCARFGASGQDALDVLQETFLYFFRKLPGFELGANSGVDWLSPILHQMVKERAENPFVHYKEPTREGNRFYSVFITRELDPFTYPGFEEGLFDFSGALPGPG